MNDPITVEISQIATLPGLQVREQMDAETVRRYTRIIVGGGELPAIALSRLPDGRLILADGWHRIAAHRNAERRTVQAIVYTESEKEAALRAIQANLTHGLPLKKAELRNAFRLYVKAGQHRIKDRGGKTALKSFRTIAEDFNKLVSHTAIASWMRQDFPNISKRYAERGEGLHEGGAGGLRPILDPAAAAKSAVQQAVAHSRALDEEGRGELIRHLDEAIKAVQSIGPWEAERDF